MNLKVTVRNILKLFQIQVSFPDKSNDFGSGVVEGRRGGLLSCFFAQSRQVIQLINVRLVDNPVKLELVHDTTCSTKLILTQPKQKVHNPVCLLKKKPR